jgi:signal transduction histidine kinase
MPGFHRLSSRSRLISAGFLLGALLLPGGCAIPQLGGSAAGQGKADSRPLYRVGFERELQPYSFVGEDGQATGNVPEMLEAIAKVMGLRLEWVPGTAGELRQALAKGEIDLLPTLPSTLANDHEFALSLAHTSVDDGIFVREAAAASKGEIGLADCLKSGEVAVLEGDPALEYLAGAAPAANTLLEPTVADALRRLAAGAAECALLPRATGLLLSRELELKNIRLLPAPVEEYDRLLTFAVRPGERHRLDAIEEGMDIVTADGTYVALFSKWTQYSGKESGLTRRLAWLLLPIVAITLFSLIWTTMLRREVARRTTDLHQAEAEKRAVEVRIAEAQKLESLTLLAGGVAHDFNNLLSAMLGNASLALYQSSPDSPVAERLREVQKAGRRAAELCQQMLAYSGRGRFMVEKLDLSKMVEEMSELLQANISKKAELVRRLADDLPHIEGDASQLGQLLMNLVVNASEALADQPGTIEIRTGCYLGEHSLEDLNGDPLPVGPYAFLEVRDNGVGMDETTRKRIFEPFFTTKFTGRGLGLAATLGIVRGHRGTLQVESRPGQGTTFRLFFPACEEPLPKASSGAAPNEHGSTAAPRAPAQRPSPLAPGGLERVESF